MPGLICKRCPRLDMKEATSAVLSEMMQNRMHLQNYLLSGDTRDLEKMNDGQE